MVRGEEQEAEWERAMAAAEPVDGSWFVVGGEEQEDKLGALGEILRKHPAGKFRRFKAGVARKGER
ncbi:MAG: hypothetical protein HYU43_05115 [Armatimonadetes bacterium]|nr:hypothetical protein [Armatimonadota bacterium]